MYVLSKFSSTNKNINNNNKTLRVEKRRVGIIVVRRRCGFWRGTKLVFLLTTTTTACSYRTFDDTVRA